MIRATKLHGASPFVSIVSPIEPVDPRIEEQVDKLWATEKKSNPQLFDGSFFRITQMDDEAIHGYFWDYKYFFAHIRDPLLRKALNIRSLAVSGLTYSKEGVYFGWRSQHSTQDRDVWELLPSGAMDQLVVKNDGAVSVEDQIASELYEELGVSIKQLASSPRPFVMLENQDDFVVDIGFMIALQEGVQVPEENSEYVKIMCVPFDDLKQFLADKNELIVPCSKALLESAGADIFNI